MLEHLKKDPALHDAVLNIAALLKQNGIKQETVYLVMYLLDSMEKCRTFARWVLKYLPEGNPLNIDSQEIERVVNAVALDRELPDITEPIARPQGRDKIIYELSFRPNSDEMLALIDDLVENHGLSLETGECAAIILTTEDQQKAFRKWLSVNIRKLPPDREIRNSVIIPIGLEKMPNRRKHSHLYYNGKQKYKKRLCILLTSKRSERETNRMKRYFETGRW